MTHKLNILKASAESVTYPPMTIKSHQAQVEHNVGVKNIFVHEMRTELSRLFPEGAPLNLMEIIKKGEQKIDKRCKLIQIADVYGWPVANEFAGNIIGLDDMDNKKLEEAEKRVRKKNETKAKEADRKNKSSWQ